MANSIYLVVEGAKTEPKLYRSWLPLLLPELTRLPTPEAAASAFGYFIVEGHGYPSYKKRVENGVADVEKFQGFTRFVVSVDSEDKSPDEVEDEIGALLKSCPIPHNVVVANCCVETWLLGNRAFVCRTPSSLELRKFLDHFDVVASDPEQMQLPTGAGDYKTRAQFHHEFFLAACRERSLTYRKNKPEYIAGNSAYLQQLINRTSSSHLRTFAKLVDMIRAHATAHSIATGCL